MDVQKNSRRRIYASSSLKKKRLSGFSKVQPPRLQQEGLLEPELPPGSFLE